MNEYKSLNFSLNEIKEILEKYNDDTELAEFMARKLEEVNAKILNYQAMQLKLNLFLKQREDTRMVKCDEITAKEIPDMLIASIRFKGRYSDVGKYMGTLFRHCGRKAAGTPFAMYHDCEYKEEDADIEVCVPVSAEVNSGEVTSKNLKGGKGISLVYQGPYEKIGQAYKTIFDYITEKNLKVVAPSREIYLKGPGMIFKGNPNNYLTEIQMIVE